jgi:uncharacterized membrane protein
MRHWYGWLFSHWEAIRESYWFYPGQMTILSGLLAVAAIELDRWLSVDTITSIPWLTRVSAESARSVLSTIAGSMMTVTGVVFSITIVALTLTSSQFGPRLLRTFFRDRSTQIALGTFLATFFYSLLVLRAVETPERVPYVATAGSVVLAGTSLFVLIYFIHHAASSLQASSVIAAVAREIETQLPALYPEGTGHEGTIVVDDEGQRRLELLDRVGVDIRAEEEGYVRVLDAETLLAWATERDLLVRVEARPGRFVSFHSVLFRVHAGDDLSPEVEAALRSCCVLGDHRTPVQDITFLTDQLSEMAVRALSPGINDPRTAIACIHRLGAMLEHLACRPMPSGFRFDECEALRIVATEPTTFESLVGSCFDPIRRHGGRDPEIAVALLEAIGRVVEVCENGDRRRVLGGHADEIRSRYLGSDASTSSRRDRELVEGVFARIQTALGNVASEGRRGAGPSEASSRGGARSRA